MKGVNIDKDAILMKSLVEFYTIKKNFKALENALKGKTKCSLRIVEWFYTNYAKRHNTHYPIGNRLFYVYSSYRDQLKMYRKESFDPFKRRKDNKDLSFDFEMNGSSIRTTISQLNFFRWAIRNEVINYVSENKEVIKRDMDKVNSIKDKQKVDVSNKKSSGQSPPKKEKKRKVVITRNVKQVSRINNKTHITFK